MICREQLDNPNSDGRYSVTGGHNDPNPQWCACRQGECEQEPWPAHWTPYGDPDQSDDDA